MGINLAFSGAGFLGIYHVGTVSCLKFYGKKLLDKVDLYGGSSAGALAACMLLCDMNLEESVQFVMNTAHKVHHNFLGPISPSFDPSASIRKTFTKYLPENAYKVASGKLHVSLTRVSDWKNEIVSEFASNKELVDAVVCSSFIPFFSGMTPPKYKGVHYIDGGFTDNLPQHFEGTTITVSPFSGESDICPDDGHKTNAQFDMRNTSVQVTAHNVYRMAKALFPPNSDVLAQMCRQGFRDTLKYLHIHYPELLNVDFTIISIPRCCDLASSGYGTDDDDTSTCSCGDNSHASMLSDLEHYIATKSTMHSLVFPEQMNTILQEAKLILIQEGDLCWYLVCTLFKIAKWLISPCYYIFKHIQLFADEIFNELLPKVKELSCYSPYTERLLKIALEIFDAYKGTATCEWHPSLKKERHTDIQRRNERFISAKKSMVAFPKSNLSVALDLRSREGHEAPPPSRISSTVQVNEVELRLDMDIMFSHHADFLSSDNNAEKDAPGDDGLVMRIDKEETVMGTCKQHTENDDYGSELMLDLPVYDMECCQTQFLRGHQKRKSWEEFLIL